MNQYGLHNGSVDRQDGIIGVTKGTGVSPRPSHAVFTFNLTQPIPIEFNLTNELLYYLKKIYIYW